MDRIPNDLSKAPMVYGDKIVDLSTPEEKAETVEVDGLFVNIPTFVDGKQRSKDEALALFNEGKTSEVGVYRSSEDASRGLQRRADIRAGRILGDPADVPATVQDDDMAGGYMGFRGTDPEEETYKQELAEARQKDQEEAFHVELQGSQGGGASSPDMPKIGEDWTPPEAGEPGSKEHRDEAGSSTAATMNVMEHPVVKFITRAPGNITVGVMDSLEAGSELLVGADNLQAANQALYQNVPGFKEFDQGIGALKQSLGGDGAADKMTQMVAQFGVPFGGYYKLITSMSGATKLTGKAASAISADALAAFTAFKPHMERFSPVLQEMGLENDFINYLSDQSGGPMEERFKNALDSAGAGAVLSPVIWGGAQMLKRAYWSIKGQEAPKAKELLRLKTGLFDLDPAKANETKQEFIQSQAGRTDLDKSLAQAKESQKELSTESLQIARELGVKFKDPGVKGKKRASEKVEAGKKVEELTDLSRGGFLVDDVAEGDKLIKKLNEKFDVLDEGVTVTSAGYFDRKVMVRTSDGTVAEIQIMEKNLADAKGKKGGGHNLYKELGDMTVRAGKLKGTVLPGREKEALENQQKQFAIYFGAAQKSGKDWQKIYEKNLDKDMLDYLGLDYGQVTKALKSGSEIDLPVSSTSSKGTGSHSPDLKTKPSSGDSPLVTPTKTPGTPSKEAGLSKSASSGKGGLPGSSIDTSKIDPATRKATEDSIRKLVENVQDFKPLRESKSRYFTRPKGTEDIDTTKIIASEPHEGGAERGYAAMSKAWEGKGSKRKPISLKALGDGMYRILDGNSTYINAAASGWKKIPALVQ